jgi:ubiquinone biosynthesis protein
MMRALRNLGRLMAIARTLARFDALFPLDQLALGPVLRTAIRLAALTAPKTRSEKAGDTPGARLAQALQALGPSFIKLGQAMSVRADLIGEDIANDLSALQDRLPPFSGRQARDAIAAEFGRPVDDLFASFGDEAIAAASIAQVHLAVTADGREVAVKVLRPGIEAAFARDLDLFLWLADLIERTRPAFRRFKPVEVVETFAETVNIEMDLRLEAAAGDELGRNFEADGKFRVPEMDWIRTGRRVLTQERIEGIPIDEAAALIAAGHDIEAIVANMARCFFLQVFRDGFFHADLHPGNLFVAEDGAIVAVDFGIMGRLDKRTRQYLAEMLLGFLTADYRRVAELHVRAGYVPADQSIDAFAQAARAIAEPILGLPLNEISLARLLAQLFGVAARFKMETQPQLLLLQKTMLVAEGVSRRLYPEANMWELARPLIEGWMADGMGAEAQIRDAMDDFARGLERLPALIADMEGSVESLARDGLKLHPDSVRALTEARRAGGAWWPLWAGAAAIAVLVAVAL